VGIEEEHFCLHSFKARLDARGYREGYNTCSWSEEGKCQMEWSESADYEPPVECRPASPGFDPTADEPNPCFNHADSDCAGVKHEETCVWSYKERVEHGDGYNKCVWNNYEEKCEAADHVIEEAPTPRCCLDEVEACAETEGEHVCLHSYHARMMRAATVTGTTRAAGPRRTSATWSGRALRITSRPSSAARPAPATTPPPSTLTRP